MLNNSQIAALWTIIENRPILHKIYLMLNLTNMLVLYYEQYLTLNILIIVLKGLFYASTWIFINCKICRGTSVAVLFKCLGSKIFFYLNWTFFSKAALNCSNDCKNIYNVTLFSKKCCFSKFLFIKES